ncbi:MAG: twin-arginine translocase TatA/TatE family subunit [Deltaproteobacteria bacterium]|nr:twin-arginine translocase TatA/TatE family subunit [Deltaproteobacteria bacterium]
MFGIGAPELIIIAIIALLIFGPSKLPELGKTIGKGLREFRNASSNLKDQINPLSGDDAGHTQLEANNIIEDKKSGEKKAAKRKTVKNIKTAATAGKKPVNVKPKKSTTSLKSAVKKTVKPKN